MFETLLSPIQMDNVFFDSYAYNVFFPLTINYNKYSYKACMIFIP